MSLITLTQVLRVTWIRTSSWLIYYLSKFCRTEYHSNTQNQPLDGVRGDMLASIRRSNFRRAPGTSLQQAVMNPPPSQRSRLGFFRSYTVDTAIGDAPRAKKPQRPKGTRESKRRRLSSERISQRPVMKDIEEEEKLWRLLFYVICVLV